MTPLKLGCNTSAFLYGWNCSPGGRMSGQSAGQVPHPVTPLLQGCLRHRWGYIPWEFRGGFASNTLWYTIWLVVLTILKKISQWEGLSHILWKIKNVWNHQPAICCARKKSIENNNDFQVADKSDKLMFVPKKRNSSISLTSTTTIEENWFSIGSIGSVRYRLCCWFEPWWDYFPRCYSLVISWFAHVYYL